MRQCVCVCVREREDMCCHEVVAILSRDESLHTNVLNDRSAKKTPDEVHPQLLMTGRGSATIPAPPRSVRPDASAVLRSGYRRSHGGEGRWLALARARGTGAAPCLAPDARGSSRRPRRQLRLHHPTRCSTLGWEAAPAVLGVDPARARGPRRKGKCADPFRVCAFGGRGAGDVWGASIVCAPSHARSLACGSGVSSGDVVKSTGSLLKLD